VKWYSQGKTEDHGEKLCESCLLHQKFHAD